MDSAAVAAAQRGLLLGLGWINERLPQFSIVEQRELQSFAKEDVARLKPVSELALTIWMLKRCGINIPFLDATAERIWDECEQGRSLIKLLLARNDFMPCCAMYAPLYQIGYRSDPLHEVLQMLAHSDMVAALPLQPWSYLAMTYNLRKLNIEGLEPTVNLYINAMPEPWVISGEVAYAVTHEGFYLTDFGFSSLGNADVEVYLKTWIPYWLRTFKHEENNDLLGEFAMVSACIGVSAETIYSESLGFVLQKQQPDGAVRGPKGAGSFLFSASDTQERRDFLESYHTTLVTLMAIALFLRTAARGRLASTEN